MAESVVPYEWSAFTEYVVANAGTLDLDPASIERCMAACQRLADRMARLALEAERGLSVDSPGLGENYIPSARLLADKYKEKAVGGSRIADENTAVGLLRAHEKHAWQMWKLFDQVLESYNYQEVTNAAALSPVRLDL